MQCYAVLGLFMQLSDVFLVLNPVTVECSREVVCVYSWPLW